MDVDDDSRDYTDATLDQETHTTRPEIDKRLHGIAPAIASDSLATCSSWSLEHSNASTNPKKSGPVSLDSDDTKSILQTSKPASETNCKIGADITQSDSRLEDDSKQLPGSNILHEQTITELGRHESSSKFDVSEVQDDWDENGTQFGVFPSLQTTVFS